MVCTACELCLKRRRIVDVNGKSSARYILLTDYPTKIDQAIGKIFSGEEFKFLEEMILDASNILNITPWSFFIVPMVKCIPIENKKIREPKPDEVLSCMPNALNQIAKCRYRSIFFDGKFVERFYRKEFPDGITLTPIKFLTEQGGKYSPWYKSNLRLLVEGISK